MIGRRGFITGLISFVAAPAIVRAGSLMPVKSFLVESPVSLRLITDYYPGDCDIRSLDILYGYFACSSGMGACGLNDRRHPAKWHNAGPRQFKIGDLK